MSESFAFFGGIDFSGAREPLANLWSAVGEEHEGRLRISSLRPHAFRADLLGYIREGWRADSIPARARILWGADFPFGLPSDVVEVLGAKSAWKDYVAWVADRPPDEVRVAAGAHARSLRAADSGGALAPLDVRLYKQTVEGLRLLHELLDDARDFAILPQAPAGDAATSLIEVYPSATIRDLGLPRRHAPGRPGETRPRAAALRTYLDFADPQTEAIAVTLEDAWDAAIACLSAFLCRMDLDQPKRVQPSAWDRIAREGWIYRSPAALA